MSDILSSLNPEQKKAVKHFKGPALVVAGPGSGKTRVLTHRVAYLIKEMRIDPHSILCVTFTNKAAGEMKERVKNLLKGSKIDVPNMGTFHSTCARILRRDGVQIGIPHDFVIYDENDAREVIKKILKKFNIPTKKFSPYAIKGRISQAKNELIDEVEFQKYAYGTFLEKVALIYPEYQKFLRESKALDFDDLLMNAAKLFLNAPKVLHKYQDQFEYLLVDEYQDTNHVQYLFLKLLAEKHKNIFIVGDMSQSIYGFRGADFRNILNFQKDYPNLAVFRLEQNYRSNKNILEAATSVISNNKTHIILDLWTKNKEEKPINLYQTPNEKTEAQYVVDRIALGRERDDINYSDFAVLYRTNAQSRSFEEAFLKSGVPYKLVGGTRFYERKEIKDVLSYLRLINNPQDEISRDRIEKLGKGRTKKFNEYSKKVDKENLPTIEILDGVLSATGYLDFLKNGTEEGEARAENVKELRSVASEFGSLADFLENISLVEGSTSPNNQKELFLPASSLQLPTSNYVTLMTLHRAKGLEFPSVFMVGMEEGLFPHSRSMMDPNELEEERRLCYVGVTRAMGDLHLTFTRKRLIYGEFGHTILSRFVEEIPDHLLEKNFEGKMAGKEQKIDDFLYDLEKERINY